MSNILRLKLRVRKLGDELRESEEDCFKYPNINRRRSAGIMFGREQEINIKALLVLTSDILFSANQ